MTQGNTAPLLPFDEPQRTLPAVHDDLSQEMARLRRDYPTRYDEAAKLFKENQEARTDVTAAETLLNKVRALTPPVTLPFARPTDVLPPNPTAGDTLAPDTSQGEETSSRLAQDERDGAQQDDVEGEAPGEALDHEVNEQDGDEELDEAETDGQTSSDAPEATLDDVPALSETPAPPVTWPAGTLGAGMISQLASTLGAGETLSLILARVGNTLLVTVQPAPIKDEPNSTAVPLQVKGLPSALDTQLGVKLEEYREGRSVARDTAHYVATVRAAADAHRQATQNAAKPKAAPSQPATPARQEGHLTVEVSPRDATLVLTDGGGKTHPFQAGKKTALPAGEYTLSLDAPGYEAQTQKLSVKPGKETKTAFVLKKASAPSLF
ncbi:PEGA domain-containing protein [Deinococcus aestuarii]|uniref:PEGA domain-containing protein n=1 Tax=Deinococcus aestuarii TaxID=2774531 RepID=UPI001C0D9B47|nr:PEGA domain-containing protein [Deinococcus aestuarii]